MVQTQLLEKRSRRWCTAALTTQAQLCTLGPHRRVLNQRGSEMLETIAIVLLILWLLGVVSSYTIGGFIHILLVVAVVMFLLRVINGRKSF
jgi:hypothetical protein